MFGISLWHWIVLVVPALLVLALLLWAITRKNR